MKKYEERIELAISQELRDALIFLARKTYGSNVTLEEAIEKIIDEWIAERELQPILQEELSDEPQDACALPEEQKEFFELAAPAIEAGILDPDYEINWLQWNGNVLENVIKARAQVMHILEPKDYPALGRKVFENILSAVEHSKGVI